MNNALPFKVAPEDTSRQEMSLDMSTTDPFKGLSIQKATQSMYGHP